MQKESGKRESPYKGILRFAKEKKSQLSFAVVLSVLSSAFGVVPYIAVAVLLQKALENSLTTTWAILLPVIALCGYLLKHALYAKSTLCSHKVAYEIIKNIRIAIMKKMAKVSMGTIQEKSVSYTHLVGNKLSKTYKFSDINYLVASREDKESMFLTYSELLNSLDSGAVTKITINNRRMNQANFETSILMPMQGDFRDEYRGEYNQMLLDKATGANGIMQEKYITISVVKKDVEEARAYFSRVGADLISHFAALGSKCVELDATERLRILHDFYRQGEESEFVFNAREMMKRGHSFKDYICPDGIEKNSDYLKLGGKFCRVLFLKDYASYIKDNMVTELTDFNRNLMFSIDIVPVPTDEAVREVENRLLGVETNITNWQRRQNANNNFSAVVPYDMELQRKESKEFLDDLTTRDQRMMFAVMTLAITADTKEQLDSDTEAVLSVARKHMCQLAVLKFQQLDGLNTALPIGARKINAFRTLTTESLAVFIPFKVQEIQDKGGIYFGENAISHNLILCNKANLLNQSAFYLGVPGAGKSFAVKELIAFLMLHPDYADDDILICDPEGEFGALVKTLGREKATVCLLYTSLPHQSQGLLFYGGHGGRHRQGGHPAAVPCAHPKGGNAQAPAFAAARPG